MDLFKSFATNEKLELDGAWVGLGGGAKILVARSGNKKYGRMLSSLVEKNQAVLDAKTDESDTVSDEIMIDVFANTILLGWEGFTDKGEPLDYTLDNAKKALELKDFRNLVATHARNIENYRNAAEAATTKK